MSCMVYLTNNRKKRTHNKQKKNGISISYNKLQSCRSLNVGCVLKSPGK